MYIYIVKRNCVRAKGLLLSIPSPIQIKEPGIAHRIAEYGPHPPKENP